MASLAGICLIAPSVALAYRPFDGTDADTAETGVIELEVGPAQYYQLAEQSYLETPSFVFNLGLGERTELVIDASQMLALGHRRRLMNNSLVPRVSLQGDDILMKHVFREGTLQGKSGISIAGEGGLLTPEINGTADIGASLNVIASYRASFGTIHWNEWFQLTRERHADLFNGIILEGPARWRVRPVSELFYERDFVGNDKASVLLGAIWPVRTNLVFDIGLRGGVVGKDPAAEGRLGLTWAFDAPGAHPPADTGGT